MRILTSFLPFNTNPGKCILPIALTACILYPRNDALAGTYNWNTTAGSWSVETNWTNTPPVGGPDAAGDVVTLSPGGTNTITLFNSDGGNATKTVGSLTFGGGTTTLSTGTGSGILDFNNSGSNAILTQTAGSGNITAPMTLTDSLSVTNQNGSGTTNRLFLSGVISGSGGLVINNAATGGMVSLGGIANTFSGGVTVNSGGILSFAGGTGASSSASALGTGALTINGGTLDTRGSAAQVITTTNAQNWNGNFSFTGSFALNLGTGSVTMNGNRTVTHSTTQALTIGGGISDGGNGYSFTLAGSGTGSLTLAGTNTYTGATTISSGTTLLLGSGGTTGSLSTSSSISNNGTLGFNRSNTVTQGTDFANVISGTGGVRQSGSGTLILNGANTYTGQTVIRAGNLSVSSLNSVSGGTTSSNLGAPSSVANGTIDIGATTVSGTLTYTGSGETTDRVVNLAGTTGGAIIDQSGTGLLKFTSGFTATGAGAKTVTLQGSSSGTGEISGTIVNSSSATSVTKSGSGTWVLSGANTYTGVTNVAGGVLSTSLLANGGSASGIGQSSNGAGNLLLGNGATIRYTGGATSTDRLFTINGTAAGHSATIDASGSGAVSLTNTGSIAYGTTNQTRTLNLRGTNTGANTLSATIANNGSGAVSVVKSDAGTWVLTGTHTYTGATTINGGTMLINGSTAAGSAVALNAATLGGSGTVGGLVTTAGTSSRLSPGNSPGTLTLAGGLNAAAGADFAFELGTSSDLLNLGSGVFTGSTAANGLVFDFADAGGLTAGTTYTLATFGSSSGLDYTDLLGNTIPSGFVLNSGFGTNGFLINSGNLQVQFSAIPEPGSYLLLGLGLLVLQLRRRPLHR